MEEDFSQVLKIPKARVGVLVGNKGETKREIETRSKTKIHVTSEGEVTIEGDSFNTWISRQIIKAIGRGFSPGTSLLLANEEYSYELIELKDWTKTENAMQRLKGRVIGRNGKSRELIEEITGCYISVYGKTISIIGKTNTILVAKKAVEMLLRGSKHATVFRLLEEERKNRLKSELVGEG